MLVLSFCPKKYVPLLNWRQLAETSVQIALSRKHKKNNKAQNKESHLMFLVLPVMAQ